MTRLGFLSFVFLAFFRWSSSAAQSACLEATPSTLIRYSFQHPQMGTLFRVVFYADMDSAQATSIATTLFSRIDSLNAVFSDWLPESELNQLCKWAGSGQRVPVSKELFDIVQQSNKYSQQTNGAFDITVGPLTRLWRRSRSLGEMPSEKRRSEALEKVGWRNVKIYRKGHRILLRKVGMALDLGGIAQGWAADDCLKSLRQIGICQALVDAGGDIAIGQAPPGEIGWKIQLPAQDGHSTTQVLTHCGITTSGATQRFVELDGKRYSHIIDPKTGMGLTHHTLVTVKGPNATTADAWATAISVLGEKGKIIASKSPDKLEVWLTESPF
jgi:thiamine biosynthesis lipoprotein